MSVVGFIGNFCSYCAMITIEGGNTFESLIIVSWLVKSRSMYDEVVFVTLVGSFIIFCRLYFDRILRWGLLSLFLRCHDLDLLR